MASSVVGGLESPFAQLVADLRSDADALERAGALPQAEAFRRAAQRIIDACPDAHTWLGEKDAALRSGWSVRQVQRHAALYERAGYARRKGRRGPWQLLAIIVPQRLSPSLLQKAAEQAAAS